MWKVAVLLLMVSVNNSWAACNSSAPASTPDAQLTDHGDGTVTDTKTGLMWKQCSEGLSGSNCVTGSVTTHTWQGALQLVETLNSSGGFAGYTDWRLPNLKELRSIVEEQCYSPAINSTRFPNTPSSFFWSSSPYARNSAYAWSVGFNIGYAYYGNRSDPSRVRLVRAGQ